MSKITFRADDDLVERLEEFDASKSEVMRQALRAYLDDTAPAAEPSPGVDGAIAERVDQLVAERLDAHLDGVSRPSSERDVNVNITLDGVNVPNSGNSASPAASAASLDETEMPEQGPKTAVDERKTPSPSDGSTSDEGGSETQTTRKPCGQCGENVAAEHVYCPNCGEKTSHRVFCDCGDELRSDWGFCPSCGRRTPAADVLDRS
jgi:Arc/MetJ-type ribon-helix-helix transcriptional regulator